MATRKGVNEELRVLRNNVVFVLADERLSGEMKAAQRRRLALLSIKGSDRFRDLPEYQQRKIDEEIKASETKVAVAALQCYRHVFYPSAKAFAGGEAKLDHTTVELPSASESPGNGQAHIKRALREQHKLLAATDEPDAPSFVRDQTALRSKGEVSTQELRAEYRKAPNLSILLDDAPLIACIRRGIEQEFFIYRSGEQIWGKGDPAPSIAISENAFVDTIDHARKHGLWPRKPKAEEQSAPPGSPPSRPGGTPKPSPPSTEPRTAAAFKEEAPLREALTKIFEQARKNKVDSLAWMSIRFFEPQGAWNLHAALSTQKDSEVTCNFQVSLSDDGTEEFAVRFRGTYAKASQVKSMIEKPLLAAKSANVDLEYRLVFKALLPTSESAATAFIAAVTKYGAATAYVEAEAAPKGGK
jgi:hypothetical protein